MKQLYNTLKTKKTFVLIPLLTLFVVGTQLALKAVYVYNPSIMYPDILSSASMFTGLLASYCMLFFLSSTQKFESMPNWNLFLISSAYGLCSYALVQEQQFPVRICYSLFPLIYLFFDSIEHHNNALYLIVILSVCLIIHPAHMLCVWTILLISTILSFIINKQSSRNEFKKLFCLLFSFCIGSFRIMSYFSECFASHSFGYDGFFASYEPAVFLSRFFAMSPSSLAITQTGGSNLYFGLFFLLMLLIYLFGRRSSEWGNDLVNLILIFCCVAFSPMQYIVSFGQPSAESISYAYVLVFFGLMLSAKGLLSLNAISKRSGFTASTIYVLIAVLVSLFASHNFHSLALTTALVFVAIYLAILVAYLFSNHTFQSSALVCSLVIAELLFNALVCTNLSMIPDTCSKEDNYGLFETNTSSQTSDSSTASVSADESESYYHNFLAEHRNLQLEATMVQLEQFAARYHILDSVDSALSKTTSFERCNLVCQKLGLTESLFTPLMCQVEFDACDQYSFYPFSSDASLFSIQQLHFHNGEFGNVYATYHLTLPKETDAKQILVTNNLDGNITLIDTSKLSQTRIPILIPQNDIVSVNISIRAFEVNEAVLEKLPSLVSEYMSAASSHVGLPDYLGMLLSIISLTLFVIAVLKRMRFLSILHSITEHIENWFVNSWFVNLICRYYVYILSFAIPFAVFVIAMIVTDCKPFGYNSLLDQDGIGLTLPSTMDLYYNLKKGNTYLSLNGGYGYSLYSINPITQLSLYFKLFSSSFVEIFLLFQEGFHIGLCGFFMTYYMTHRLHRKAAYYKNPFLIACACIYAMNAYMLAMHSFTSWYLFLALVPLTLLALDYLMYQKRIAPYIVLLSLCIIFSLYHALYLCIFLVIWFFTYRFDNTKDFLTKGIRFGICSLLCGGNAFFIITSTFTGVTYSNYQEQDSAFPHLGLHTNFLNIFKQQMIFPYTTAVTPDDGYASIYFGLFAFVLLLLYFIKKGDRLAEKLRRIIPILIMYWCLNGKVMSFIWNGFHYQSKVPNRYAFLLMFCIAELAYDVFVTLRKKDTRKVLFCTLLATLLFVSCYLYNSSISKVSFVCTLAVLFLYAIFVCFSKPHRKKTTYLFTSLLVVELTVNALYTTAHYPLTDIITLGDYTETERILNQELIPEGTYQRVQFPSTKIYNSSIYGVGSSCLFNSFVGLYQTNTNSLYGYLSGVNYIRSEHAGSMFSNMFSATGYILNPVAASDICRDLEQYPYVGTNNIYYILKNPLALSLGIYLPDIALKQQAYIGNTIELWNHMLEDFTDGKKVLHDQYLAYATGEKTTNRFYFTDYNGKELSIDDVNDLLIDIMHSDESDDFVCSDIQMHLDFIADHDGYAYIYPNEYIGLKEVKKGEHVSITINYPSLMPLEGNIIPLVIQNKQELTELYDKITQNQMENISIHNNCIEGTVDYDEEGYTFFSLAYDKSWHAYIDGKEVDVEDPYYSSLAVKTPAGKHTITLKYVPYGMWSSKLISLGFILLSLLFIISHKYLLKKRLPIHLTEQENKSND